MGNTIVGVVGLLLALYAAADLIIRICYRLLFGRRTAGGHLVLHVQQHDAEFQIRRFSVWRTLVPNGGYDWVVLVPDHEPKLQQLCAELGLTAHTEKEWERMCKSSLQSKTDGV